MASADAALPKLFADLDRALAQATYEKASDICAAILKLQPEDRDALLTRIVVLIKLGNFDGALTQLGRLPDDVRATLAFEEAYCLYRSGKQTEALALLRAQPEPATRRAQILRAQIHYKVEQYAEASELLWQLVSEPNEDEKETQELWTNYVAACSAGGLPIKLKNLNVQAHELALNLSIHSLGRGDAVNATKRARDAEALCKEAFADEEDASVLAEELAPILVQQGCILQHQGDNNAAAALYETALKSGPEKATLATASNNLIGAGKRDLFGATKRLKALTSEAVLSKTIASQRLAIHVNDALVRFHMSKAAQARGAATRLATLYPASEVPGLMLAAAWSKGGSKADRSAQVIAELQTQLATFTAANPTAAPTRLSMALAQAQAGAGDFAAAAATLAALPPPSRFAPAIVSVLCTLWVAAGQAAEISPFLDQCIAANSSPAVLRLAARFKRVYGDARGAAAIYERLIASMPEDTEALAGLIRSLALVDPAQAEKYESAMPEVTPAGDVDAIESQTVLRTFRSARVAAGAADGVASTVPTSAKPKRKHKTRLPKNAVPGAYVDPERWLPLRERSSYRKKKGSKTNRDREMSKGASQGAAPSAGSSKDGAKDKGAAPQGAAPAAGSSKDGAKDKEAAPPSPSKPAATAPASQQKKKGKGKGGKW